MTDIEKIFSLSKAAANTDNHQELLPVNGWIFPRGTWLQRRIEELKNKEAGDETKETY